ncbi:hypothetical protein PULV_a4045 [Pseudoalteromonas ulvae UL12]|uniref:hypothetical protein n=1 Tax=Pseudoalteromonas ulvae TaxID=107327 RepID=UPI00186B6136|nr:hypothetical protein [Pseudoalteromonas ulvae]MBE0362229.1 hypothetical protein [Pseudoalteromonas ulvae UL12]
MESKSFCEQEVLALIADAENTFLSEEYDRLNGMCESFLKPLDRLRNERLSDTSDSLLRVSTYLKKLSCNINGRIKGFKGKDEEAFQLGSWFMFWCDSKSGELSTVGRVNLFRYLNSKRQPVEITNNVVALDGWNKKVA